VQRYEKSLKVSLIKVGLLALHWFPVYDHIVILWITEIMFLKHNYLNRQEKVWSAVQAMAKYKIGWSVEARLDINY